jgi:hypothetical protein
MSTVRVSLRGVMGPPGSLATAWADDWDDQVVPYAAGKLVRRGTRIYLSLKETSLEPGTFAAILGRDWVQFAADGDPGEPGASAEPPVAVTTDARPDPLTLNLGTSIFDLDLNRPIWLNATGDGWVDATGTAV